MTITITIQADNAAFDPWTTEVARILREAAKRIQHNDPEERADRFKLFDLNGNSVGTVEISA